MGGRSNDITKNKSFFVFIYAYKCLRHGEKSFSGMIFSVSISLSICLDSAINIKTRTMVIESLSWFQNVLVEMHLK